MEQNPSNKEYMMLTANYDFNATVDQTLSFKKHDFFIFHSTNNIEKKWWCVINKIGQVGYIPYNYISTVQADSEKLNAFITDVIEHLSKEISKDSGSQHKILDLIQELMNRRQRLTQTEKDDIKTTRLVTSKSLPTSNTSLNTAIDQSEALERQPSEPLKLPSKPLQPILKKKKDSVESIDSSEESVKISDEAVYNLVQQVRNETGLSYTVARTAVEIVTASLTRIVPLTTSDSLLNVLDTLRNQSSDKVSDFVLDATEDCQKLRCALDLITTFRQDDQQRSWQLWDDEESIRENVLLISSILENADPAICERVLKINDYIDVIMLVEYYQMEERWTIRRLIIQVFAIMCTLDKTVISILLNSVLPMELAKDLYNNCKSLSSRLLKPAMLLTIIFSTGEPMPITHLDQLGEEFIKLILNLMECNNNGDDLEAADVMLTLLLSYNLQFITKSSNNITIQVLEDTDFAKTFTEKILLLINREEDPVAQLCHYSSSQHSVLKLFKDLFANKTAVKLFYSNDIKVLIDILTRQITDLSASNSIRTEYLDLIYMVLNNVNPELFLHRLEDLKTKFLYILNEETPPIESDRTFVRLIMDKVPQFQMQLSRSSSMEKLH